MVVEEIIEVGYKIEVNDSIDCKMEVPNGIIGLLATINNMQGMFDDLNRIIMMVEDYR